MARRLCLFAILGVFLLGPWARLSCGQISAAAQLNGTVRDVSGGTVARAAVTLRETNTNRSYSTVSNESGLYVFASVPPGHYELTTEVTGFAKSAQTGIVLTVGQTATLDVTLRVATGTEKVVVTTETPVIETTKTEISQLVETQQIDSLPISNRVFTDFALLTPGVATSRTSLGTVFTEFEVTQISFGGQRSFSNEITVDGADFVNSASGIQRSTPPQDSVQEFRVVNSSFGADYGRAMGGIVNIVTKSGTNSVHGSLYEYFQNNATDARSLLQPSPLPYELRQNQFGGAVGGPVVKDKSFFYANYEGKRSAKSPTYAPDFIANLTLVDAAKAQLGLAPEGCFASLATCGTNLTQQQAFSYINGFLQTGDNDTGFVRFDHQITTNNRLALRYNVEDVRALGELVGQPLDNGGIAVPSAGRNLFVRDQSVVATVNSLLKPNLINTVLVQYARRHYNFPGATGQPDLDLANDLQFGHNFGANDRLYETRAQLSDSVSWVKGNHLIKFGADGNWLTSLENFPGFTPVRLIIPAGLPCLYAFAQFYTYGPTWQTTAPPGPLQTLGSRACPVASGDNGVVVAYAGVPLPTSPSFQTGAPLVLSSNGTNLNTSTWSNAYPQSLFSNYSKVIDHGYWGGFIQDQWRITPKLSLNAGLRWDVESGLSKYVTQDYGGWQPRVGLAFSPDKKTVIRVGFGMFDDRYNLTFFFVPNTQKAVPGYLCGNNPPASVKAACASAGVLGQNLPMYQGPSQATQGYQLAGFPGSTASAFGASVLKNGGYDLLNPVSLVGTCFTGTIPGTGGLSGLGSPFLGLFPGAECGIGEGGMDHKVSKIPYAEQASAEIDRQFGGGFSLSMGYLFVGAHRLVRGNNINVPCPVGTSWTANELSANGGPTSPLGDWVQGMLHANGTFSSCGNGTPTLATGALAGLGPFFAGVSGSGLQTISAGLLDYNNGVVNAVYHAGTLSAVERIKYFSLTANYTYSHTIDNGNFTTFINLPVDQLDYRAERANSNQDVRHHFVTNFTATAPSTGWYRNFQLSSIITIQSGRPFTLYYGADTLNDFAGASTDRVGGAPFFSGATGSKACLNTSNCQTMIPRNTYVGDPLRTWDLRIGRTFHVAEGKKVELAMDAFNFLNRANVDQIYSVYGSPVFCGTPPTIPGRYKDAVTLAIQRGAASTACPTPAPADGLTIPGIGSFNPSPITTAAGGSCLPPNIASSCVFIPANPNSSFGTPRTTLNPRQLQFSLKFLF